jgi:hypothetical protein
MLIDPVTLDYVDTDGGDWQETADSRTLVMCMLEIRLGSSYSAPEDGTEIKAMLERGSPVTPEIVVAETDRAMSILVADGLIEDVTINTDKDETGRFVLVLHWRDLASGSPVDLVYAPFQG